jgi:ATP-dependent Clp protease adaptor protein ClpS
VIRVLQDVCLHNKEQAEQCAVLTHYKGYCEIKRGALVELEQLQQLLSDRELIVTIN